ncbi:hypothetical protein OPV22_021858 [Ensete ventricosum]|uniref:Secreted protein n=1 Tax=Ensete ventricosum TaxID=4639 RepID=A0AAV8PBC0_ENSVE|nr:hypothetical protein OPV22_021858 [Ensete ventricosum]
MRAATLATTRQGSLISAFVLLSSACCRPNSAGPPGKGVRCDVIFVCVQCYLGNYKQRVQCEYVYTDSGNVLFRRFLCDILEKATSLPSVGPDLAWRNRVEKL